MMPWEDALQAFLAEWRDKECVIGALVCGSFVTGNATPHSDIDVHIVLADGTDWRERGNRIVDGFLVEYFANPPAQIRHYFRADYSNNRRSAAVQFATGQVIFDSTGTVACLKAEAAEWAAKPFERPSEAATELAKYGLWDNLDNLRDAFAQQSPDLAYVYHHTIGRIYAVYARFLRLPEVDFAKQWKCLFSPELARAKYLLEPFPDGRCLELLSEAIRSEELRLAEELTDHVLRKMGGFEIDGWNLRSPAKK